MDSGTNVAHGIPQLTRLTVQSLRKPDIIWNLLPKIQLSLHIQHILYTQQSTPTRVRANSQSNTMDIWTMCNIINIHLLDSRVTRISLVIIEFV